MSIIAQIASCARFIAEQKDDTPWLKQMFIQSMAEPLEEYAETENPTEEDEKHARKALHLFADFFGDMDVS